MNGNAPNLSLTGSQLERPRKSNPNLWNASFECIAISTMINAARPATTTAKAPVVHLKRGSPILARDLSRDSPEADGTPGPRDPLGPGAFPASVDSMARLSD